MLVSYINIFELVLGCIKRFDGLRPAPDVVNQPNVDAAAYTEA